MSERLPHKESALIIEPEKQTGIESALGLNGPGVFHIPHALSESFREQLLDESSTLEWRNAGGTYRNERGLTIVQNHDVFALKLSRGDKVSINEVPLMMQLANETEIFVRSLDSQYPSLSNWVADEMSYHRYYNEETGLSLHRDNIRFWGLIVVIVVDGESDFQVARRTPLTTKWDSELQKSVVETWEWHELHTIATKPGSMILTRASGLIPNMTSEDRPEHAVINIKDAYRISFMLRANDRPDDMTYGFQYQNWP